MRLLVGGKARLGVNAQRMVHDHTKVVCDRLNGIGFNNTTFDLFGRKGTAYGNSHVWDERAYLIYDRCGLG